MPRLKKPGITIVWLMPIHEIGEMNRKGALGSPYSVKDYFNVNPEFGTLDDLKNFVARAHELGMYVIIGRSCITATTRTFSTARM